MEKISLGYKSYTGSTAYKLFEFESAVKLHSVVFSLRYSLNSATAQYSQAVLMILPDNNPVDGNAYHIHYIIYKYDTVSKQAYIPIIFEYLHHSVPIRELWFSSNQSLSGTIEIFFKR